MIGTYITWRFLKYHAIPYVRTRSAMAKTTKKYQGTEKGKEVGRQKSKRYREKCSMVDRHSKRVEGGD
jgi:hypothetical protein